MDIQILSEDMKGREHLEDLGIDQKLGTNRVS
jgi:hypothetical protein